MRKKQALIFKDIIIEKIAAEGKGIGKYEGKVVFVDFAIPGDIVDVYIQKNKKDYAVGNIVQLTRASELRITPRCTHFGVCGGCKWQNISYHQQLLYKQQIVEEAYYHILKNQSPVIEPIKGCEVPFYYRNKMDYAATNRRWLTKEQIESGHEYEKRGIGFHVPGKFEAVTHIEECVLMDDLQNTIRNTIYDYVISRDISCYNVHTHLGMLRNIIMRNTTDGKWMVLIIFGEDDIAAIDTIMNDLAVILPQVENLLFAINTKYNDSIHDLSINTYKGNTEVVQQLGDKQFFIHIKSFFQTNPSQAKTLYDIVKLYAMPSDEDIIYDLYTGTGSIAIYISDSCKKVVGIELNTDAIEDAKRNAKLNDIDNCTFYASAAEKLFDIDFVNEHGHPDIVITDPPRAGMHPDVVKVLLTILPSKIVYVSCNPATQARDIALLSEKYAIEKLQPVDMFPHTYHVENVALLTLRDL